MKKQQQPLLAPQIINNTPRIPSQELSRLARVTRQSFNVQEGLGFCVEFKVGDGIQKPMFELEDEN